MKTNSKFWEGYDEFKKYHNSFLNILFHLLTIYIQIICFVFFLVTFRPSFILVIVGVPFITDGIGHLLERNFGEVVELSKKNKSTNSSGVNGFYNFAYKIMVFIEFFKNRCSGRKRK